MVNILNKVSSLFDTNNKDVQHKPFSSSLTHLNLGCGYDKRDGYINVDLNSVHNPDIVADVSDLHMLNASTYEYILANDILEHLNRHKIKNTLKEWNRVLKVSGHLEIQVPSIVDAVELLLSKGKDNVEFHYTLLQNIFGTQHYPGDFHHYSFTKAILSDLMKETGFKIESIELVEGWLFIVHAKKVEHRYPDDLYSLKNNADFLDAVYIKYLQRSIDGDGLASMTDLLQQGIPREAIVNMVRTSPEYKRIQSENIGYEELLELESDSEFLNAIYQRMLNRPLDEHGRFHYGLRLQGGTLREVIISELKNSEEYKQALL